MTTSESSPVRSRRSDAQRNRERLIAVARVAFASADDTVALETVARGAGVGIGTLYRHFPTREALVEAVYGAELDALTAGAADLLAELPPDLALRTWMRRYADFAARKRGIIDTLRAGWASGRLTTPATRERITEAINVILTAGVKAAVFRPDVTAADVTAMLLGVFLSTATNPTGGQTSRLLDLTVDALREPPSS